MTEPRDHIPDHDIDPNLEETDQDEYDDYLQSKEDLAREED